MTKITKVWFDENLGDVQQEEILQRRIWLTREELAARFDINLVNEPCKPEIWGVDFAQPGSDRTVAWHGGQQLGKSQITVEMLKRMSDELTRNIKTEPCCLTADLYDRMQSEGMCLGGVTRLDPPSRYAVRPPAAAQKRAALHPLVARLIENLNKEN